MRGVTGRGEERGRVGSRNGGEKRREGRKERGGDVKAIERRGEGMGGEVKEGERGHRKGSTICSHEHFISPQSEKNDPRHRMAGFGRVYAPNF